MTSIYYQIGQAKANLVKNSIGFTPDPELANNIAQMAIAQIAAKADIAVIINSAPDVLQAWKEVKQGVIDGLLA